MKNKVLTKMMAVILSTAMIMSLALTCVSAIPADYTAVGTNGEFIDFENGKMPHISVEGGTTLSVTEKYAHSGTHSLAVADPTDGHAKFYYSNGVKFEPNSAYYVSYWYYTDAGWNNNFAGTDAAGGMTLGKVNCSSTKNGQWNKVWYTITTGNTVSGQYFRPQFYNIGKERTVYVDDFEVVQVTSANGKVNEVPAGAKVEISGIANFEKNGLTGFSGNTPSVDKVTLDIANAHWGEAALKYEGLESDEQYRGFYINTKTSFDKEIVVEAGEDYYLSYYVYSPDSPVTVSTYLIASNNGLQETTIPQGEWTRVQAVFTCDAASASNDNKHLLRSYVKEASGKTVYFDDFVFAKFTSIASETLTVNDVDYDFEEKIATVTLDSSTELVSGIDVENITVPEGATVRSAVLSSDGKIVTVEISGVESGKTVALAFSNVVLDTFGRTRNFETTFTTPSAFVFGDVTETVSGDNATYTKNITKNTNGSANIAMIVTTYNAQGEMIAAAMDINTVNGNGVAVPFSVTLPKGASYKALVFDWADFSFINE